MPIIHLLQRFEMTLKEMIEEARIMAETPDPGTIEETQEDINQESEVSSRKSSTSQGIYFTTIL